MLPGKHDLFNSYKDELLMNQLKKLIETNDDKEDAVSGTKDNTIDIVFFMVGFIFNNVLNNSISPSFSVFNIYLIQFRIMLFNSIIQFRTFLL